MDKKGFYRDLYQEKNREYGSYQLRQRMNKLASKGFASGALLVILGYLSPLIWMQIQARKNKKDKLKMEQMHVVSYSELMAPPPIETLPPPQEILEKPLQPSSIKYTKPVVKPDDEVPEDTYIPTQDDFEKANPGLETVAGHDSIVISQIDKVLPPERDQETDQIFVAVEKNPEFPGGMPALNRYMANELRYPTMARELNIHGMVIVQFVVWSDGSIRDVEVLRGIGGGCDEEAIRVVQQMPNWIPGEQSGRKVHVKFAMPIRFTLIRN
jgi:periplasmic protein TonB